jgi:hypothetical protein
MDSHEAFVPSEGRKKVSPMTKIILRSHANAPLSRQDLFSLVPRSLAVAHHLHHVSASPMPCRALPSRPSNHSSPPALPHVSHRIWVRAARAIQSPLSLSPAWHRYRAVVIRGLLVPRRCAMVPDGWLLPPGLVMLQIHHRGKQGTSTCKSTAAKSSAVAQAILTHRRSSHDT